MKTATQERAVDLFAETGLFCAQQSILSDAVGELAERLEQAGLGGLLAELAETCWEQHDETGRCPRCGHVAKQTPGGGHRRGGSPKKGGCLFALPAAAARAALRGISRRSRR